MLNNENKTIVLWVILLCTASALAAPGLDIRNPVVDPGWTGPSIDPDANQGQWFNTVNDPNSGFARPYEFYDNKIGAGGGFQSTRAIYGKVTAVTGGFGVNITALSITATITNDNPGDGNWASGNNSHNESNAYLSAPLYMHSAILTGDFAIRDLLTLPSSFVGAYQDRQPYIIATNEDWAPGTVGPRKQTPTMSTGAITCLPGVSGTSR